MVFDEKVDLVSFVVDSVVLANKQVSHFLVAAIVLLLASGLTPGGGTRLTSALLGS